MKLVFYTNSVSAHQLPLAREIVAQIGVENYRYVYTGEALQGGGQEVTGGQTWILKRGQEERGIGEDEVDDWLENADVLMSGLRDVELFERRVKKELKTLYCSERWFKPFVVHVKGMRVRLPGRLRMLVPGYRRTAKRLVSWLNSDPNARYLAVGPWAKKDMMWLGVPEDKIVDWGYFVEKGSGVRGKELGVMGEGLGVRRDIRVLWVGRILDWKRVDVIVRAVASANELIRRKGLGVRGQELEGGVQMRFSLTLVGDGPEKERLQKLADKLLDKINPPSSTSTSFLHLLPPVPIAEVRTLMQNHDIYVLASNAEEGWGAALNEAMEEGVTCFGTYEAGASAALLPRSNLFRVGDWHALAELLVAYAEEKINHPLSTSTSFLHLLPHAYTPKGAADKLMELIK